ncbi:hypothetical protein SAMN05216428_103220 [Nitrosospira sp. Nsp11]|nr:hypothetical protein SAMN05216428_103220 [Nitrosospira sp. Nsp11]
MPAGPFDDYRLQVRFIDGLDLDQTFRVDVSTRLRPAFFAR